MVGRAARQAKRGLDTRGHTNNSGWGSGRKHTEIMRQAFMNELHTHLGPAGDLCTRAAATIVGRNLAYRHAGGMPPLIQEFRRRQVGRPPMTVGCKSLSTFRCCSKRCVAERIVTVEKRDEKRAE